MAEKKEMSSSKKIGKDKKNQNSVNEVKDNENTSSKSTEESSVQESSEILNKAETKEEKVKQDDSSKNVDDKNVAAESTTDADKVQSVSDSDLLKKVKRVNAISYLGSAIGFVSLLGVIYLSIGQLELAQRPLPKSYDQDISELKAKSDGFSAEFHKLISEQNNANLANLKKQQDLVKGVELNQDHLNKAINDLQIRLGDRTPDNVWQVYEVAFLIHMADRKVQVDQDYGTAINLLKDADKILVTLNDVKARELRKSISVDINELGNIPKQDREGVMIKITSLLDNIGVIPLRGLGEQSVNKSGNQGVSSDFSNWKENLLASLEGFFGSFISVRKKMETEPEYLPPENERYLRENIRNLLITSSLAYYRSDYELYKLNLDKATNVISNNFSQDDATVKNTLAIIDELKNVSIGKTAPKYLESQVQVNSYLKTVEKAGGAE